MKIISLDVNKYFKFLWLKSVLDVDLSQHCAHSLIGEYEPNINNSVKHIENLNINNDIHYLCGVAFPYNWNNNFHLAFKYSQNHILKYSNNGISVVIQDAVALPISPKYINTNDKHYNTKSYYTCRNWQFAHYFNTYLKKH